jgi:GNAT superfamily N-acetyltransferase
MGVVVRRVAERDRERWAELYRGYSAFYEVPPPDLDRLWERITAAGELECFVAELDGDVVGLAHLRAFARPLEGDWGGFLDDLFVDPSRRGGGAGEALLQHLRSLAAERGWGVVSWITGADNHVARRLYDRLAEAQPWVTYDMSPEPSAAPSARPAARPADS